MESLEPFEFNPEWIAEAEFLEEFEKLRQGPKPTFLPDFFAGVFWISDQLIQALELDGNDLDFSYDLASGEWGNNTWGVNGSGRESASVSVAPIATGHRLCFCDGRSLGKSE